MATRHIVSVLSGFFSVCLCSCVSYKIDDYNRIVPKHPNWSVQPSMQAENALIDYERVYYHEFATPGPLEGPSEKIFGMICFFDSGHFMSANSEGSLDIEKIGDFRGNGIGYFRINGNQIIIETYSSINGGSYFVDHAFVNQEGEVVFKNQGLLRNFNSRELVFVPGPKLPLEKSPDW